MKTLCFALLTLLLFQCGQKGADPTPVNQTVIPIPGVGDIAEDNVSVWEKTKTIDIITYYTSIDTTVSPVALDWQISAIYPEGDNVTFAWSLSGLPAILKSDKTWLSTEQKWAAISTVSYNPLTLPASVPINAAVTFTKANKTVSRQSTLTLNKKTLTYDLFRVNFGMSRDQVKTNEMERLGIGSLGWQDNSPNLVEVTNQITNGNYTVYEFDANQLKAVSITSHTSEVDDYIIQRVKKLNPPVALTMGPLTRDVTWSNGKLKFTLHTRGICPEYGYQKYLCLTYEKQL